MQRGAQDIGKSDFAVRRPSSVLVDSAATYQKLVLLYQNESKDFSSMVSTVKDLVFDVNDKLKETASNINQLMRKTAKEQNVKQKAGKFLDGKTQELKNKNKNIESIVSGLKETVSKVDPKGLAKLPVQKERILQTTFQLVYKVLYPASVGVFQWKAFKNTALLTDNGEDFQARMANVNVRKLSEDSYKSILALKADPEFNNLCENQKYSQRLFDLSDWMEYVCKGYEFYNDWKGTHDNYDKIQKNVIRRDLEGVQAKEALDFWKQTHETTEEFRQFFGDIESRLKAVQIEFHNTAPKMSDALKNHQSMIRRANQS